MIAAALIFDMDGLLLDTEKVCLDCFVETRRLFSLSASPEGFLRCVGLRGSETAHIIRESLDDRVDLRTFNEEWDKRIKASLSRHIPLKPGARQLVRFLAAKGHVMGVATSTQTERARDQLRRSGLLAHMTCVVGADMVERHKPNPEVYHKAAQLLEQNITGCIAFEDSDAGTRAAVASGARTVQVPDLIQPSEDLAKLGHMIAPSLWEGALRIGLVTSSDMPLHRA